MKLIQTEDAPAAIGPYSQAVVHGDLVFAAGQIALDPDTGEMVGDSDVREETIQALSNLGAVLAAAGSDLAHVLRCDVFVSDLTSFEVVNEAYAEHFGSHAPARTTVEVARLPRDARVEIAAIAARIG